MAAAQSNWKYYVITVIFQVLILKPLMWITGVFVAYTSRNQQKRTERRYLSILDSTEDHQTWTSTALSLDNLRGFKRWYHTVPQTSYCNPDGLLYETHVARELIS